MKTGVHDFVFCYTQQFALGHNTFALQWTEEPAGTEEDSGEGGSDREKNE